MKNIGRPIPNVDEIAGEQFLPKPSQPDQDAATDDSAGRPDYRESNISPAECIGRLKQRIEAKLQAGAARLWPGDAFIAPAVLNCQESYEESRQLLIWAQFSPVRPYIGCLNLVRLPGHREHVLTVTHATPENYLWAVCGVLPEGAEEEKIAEAALALFARNGDPSCTVVDGLPSSIVHCENNNRSDQKGFLNPSLTMSLFRLAARHAWTPAMAIMCEHLRRYVNPWERAQAAKDWGYDVDTGRIHFVPTRFNEPQFTEWYRLVTDPAHVEIERVNHNEAWRGAIHARNEKLRLAN